jgi:hypothetical protein
MNPLTAKTRVPLSVLGVLVSTTFACAGGDAASRVVLDIGPSSAETMSFSLPGFNETLLVTDEAGAAFIIRVGPTSTKTKVHGMPRGRILAGESRAGGFHLLTADGTLLTIDASSAQVTQTTPTGLRNVAAFAMAEEDRVAYVSAESKVYKIDPRAGFVGGYQRAERGRLTSEPPRS